jgi:MinD superfamily P-loop ATPase
VIRLALASGKGGTGKTTLSTSLAATAAMRGMDAAYVDCDVEEPNGHLFLHPDLEEPMPVQVPVPEVDAEACTLCGRCGEVCQFGAIAALPNAVATFPELCHGCGGCSMACPADAIPEVGRPVGRVEAGTAAVPGGALRFVHGVLNVGEAMAPPVIDAVLESAPQVALTVVDSPPGTACPMIAALRGSDYVVLVTEPTPFGLSDLRLAAETVEGMGIPYGVAVNRSDIGDDSVVRWCAESGVELLAQIPSSRRLAEAYALGELLSAASEEVRRWSGELLDSVLAGMEESGE